MSERHRGGPTSGGSRMEHAWENILKRNEQRSSARHAAFEQLAWIAWYEDGEFHSADGALQDISRGGAALEVRTAPPDGTIWVCLEAADRVWGAEFAVIATTPGRSLAHRLRGRFVHGCPEELYRVALRGYRVVEAKTPHSRGSRTGLWKGLKKRVLGQADRVGPEAETAPLDSVALRPLVLRLLTEGASEVHLSSLVGRAAPSRANGGKVASKFVIPAATAPFQDQGGRPWP